jgi:hypothetical protein
LIRISITSTAFDAIAKTLPLGSVGFEREATAMSEARGMALSTHSGKELRGRG